MIKKIMTQKIPNSAALMLEVSTSAPRDSEIVCVEINSIGTGRAP